MKKSALDTTIESMYKTLKQAPADSFRSAFVKYCREALALEQQYSVSKQTVAYVIAGAMFLDGANEPQIEEITIEAGALEFPSRFSDQAWQHLLALIEELADEI